MRQRFATILLVSLIGALFATPGVLLEAQQAGVAHPMTLVQAVAPDGSGGAFFAGQTQNLTPDHAQPPPAADPGSVYQSFVAHVGTQSVTNPAPPADIVLYANDLNANAPSAIAGDWQIDTDSSAAGGFALHEVDHGNPKVPAPIEYPANYFELTFLADANVPYHLWMRMRADADYWQNDSVWVQFSDSIEAGGNPVWRIHSADGTFVSLEFRRRHMGDRRRVPLCLASDDRPGHDRGACGNDPQRRVRMGEGGRHDPKLVRSGVRACVRAGVIVERRRLPAAGSGRRNEREHLGLRVDGAALGEVDA